LKERYSGIKEKRGEKRTFNKKRGGEKGIKKKVRGS